MSHWLIAGASRGIGLELVRQLVARGEQVTASVRTGGEALEKALAPAGRKGRILVFDTRDEAAARAAAAQVSEPVDVLIANAGAYGPQRQSVAGHGFRRRPRSSQYQRARAAARRAGLPAAASARRAAAHRVHVERARLHGAGRDLQRRLSRLEGGAQQDRAMSGRRSQAGRDRRRVDASGLGAHGYGRTECDARRRGKRCGNASASSMA